MPVFDIIYNHQMIFNETEKITNSNQSAGLISEKTRLANHPWVEDPQKEMDMIEADKARQPKIDLSEDETV
jgi:hypothetical protein